MIREYKALMTVLYLPQNLVKCTPLNSRTSGGKFKILFEMRCKQTVK